MDTSVIKVVFLENRTIKSQMYFQSFNIAIAQAVLWCGITNTQTTYVVPTKHNIRWIVGVRNSAMITSPAPSLIWDNENLKEAIEWTRT